VCQRLRQQSVSCFVALSVGTLVPAYMESRGPANHLLTSCNVFIFQSSTLKLNGWEWVDYLRILKMLPHANDLLADHLRLGLVRSAAMDTTHVGRPNPCPEQESEHCNARGILKFALLQVRSHSDGDLSHPVRAEGTLGKTAPLSCWPNQWCPVAETSAE
jgi:hypothetical protein